jgi:hypothetical protein
MMIRKASESLCNEGAGPVAEKPLIFLLGVHAGPICICVSTCTELNDGDECAPENVSSHHLCSESDVMHESG